MAKIILAMFATLDGYVEDQDGSMIRPEWSDDLEQFWSSPNIDAQTTLLYGSTAFQQNAKIWPKTAANPHTSASFRTVAERMNGMPKVVISKSLETTEWNAQVSHLSL